MTNYQIGFKLSVPSTSQPKRHANNRNQGKAEKIYHTNHQMIILRVMRYNFVPGSNPLFSALNKKMVIPTISWLIPPIDPHSSICRS